LYEISNDKKVRNIESGLILKSTDTHVNSVTLSLENGERKQILAQTLYEQEFSKPEKFLEFKPIKLDNDVGMRKEFGDIYNGEEIWTTITGFKRYEISNMGRVIFQYDKNNKLIKKWNNIKEILEVNREYKYNQLMSCLTGYRKYVYDCKFEYEEKDPVKFEKDEKFKNIGTFNEHDFSIYQVSNYGKVKNIKRNLILNPVVIGGYNYVSLFDQNKKQHTKMSIHRLVAYKFCVGFSTVNNIVNHLDENKLNNHYENLEWTTTKGNVIHSLGKKVNQIDIETEKVIKTFDTITDAYLSFNKPCNSHISRACAGIESQALGYKWKYVNDDIYDNIEAEIDLVDID
jgi:hypothetical protein